MDWRSRIRFSASTQFADWGSLVSPVGVGVPQTRRGGSTRPAAPARAGRRSTRSPGCMSGAISPPTSRMSLLYLAVKEDGLAQKITHSRSATRPTPRARARPMANSSRKQRQDRGEVAVLPGGREPATRSSRTPSVPIGSTISTHIVSASRLRRCARANRTRSARSRDPSTSAAVARSPPIRLREICTGAPKFGRRVPWRPGVGGLVEQRRQPRQEQHRGGAERQHGVPQDAPRRSSLSRSTGISAMRRSDAEEDPPRVRIEHHRLADGEQDQVAPSSVHEAVDESRAWPAARAAPSACTSASPARRRSGTG